MKKILQISVLILVVLFLSCKTQKQTVSTQTQPPKSSSQTVGLPKIPSQEKKLSTDEVEEISEYAKKMAELYCLLSSYNVEERATSEFNEVRRYAG